MCLFSSNLLLQAVTLEQLLQHLPAIGCGFCSLANPPVDFGRDKKCDCDTLFLKPSKLWRKNDGACFIRARRSRTWLLEVISNIYAKAGLEARCTTVTELTQGAFR